MKNTLYTLFGPIPEGENQTHEPTDAPTDGTLQRNSTKPKNEFDLVIETARIPTVSLYPRHSKHCPHYGDKSRRDCRCPVWVYWSHAGKEHRRSAKTRSWTKAEAIRLEIEQSYDPVRAQLKRLKESLQPSRVKIADARTEFLSDTATKRKGPGTRYMLEYLLGRLHVWCESKGIHHLDEITVNQLTRWRSTWRPYKNETIRTYQAKLGKFFKFCVRQSWLSNNPVRLLEPIEGLPSRPTDYFDREEFEKLVAATDSISDSPARPNFAIRLRTMLVFRRWSGLRLGDAVTLERSRLMGKRILLRQAKTGVAVFVSLPPGVAKALRDIPPGRNSDGRFFFWDGANKRSAVAQWEEDFNKLFRIADLRTLDGMPKRCHGQMLRDTFAIELLLAGVPIEQVSELLGHSSILVTQRRYLPWVPARQQQLEASLKKAHRMRGITKCVKRTGIKEEPSLFNSGGYATGSKSKKVA